MLCYRLNFLFEQLVKGQNVGLHALKQRLSQNRWLLPLCWCSSDFIIQNVFTPDYVIRKHHFLPHLLTFNGVIYTFRIKQSGKCKKCPDYVFRIHPFNININIHQGCLNSKIHEFVWNSFSRRCSNYIFQTRGIFGKK